MFNALTVMPAKAGIHDFACCMKQVVDAGLRRHDALGHPT
jgi:hypothetical protein